MSSSSATPCLIPTASVMNSFKYNYPMVLSPKSSGTFHPPIPPITPPFPLFPSPIYSVLPIGVDRAIWLSSPTTLTQPKTPLHPLLQPIPLPRLPCFRVATTRSITNLSGSLEGLCGIIHTFVDELGLMIRWRAHINILERRLWEGWCRVSHILTSCIRIE